ncbi:hydroxyacylglutathione hydrolase [Novosphingobium sp. SG707]|uniref:hydroxyacylglutathione hydrolase n=1 Tax=Novosphingobium sp. SG707 TaxID=2586996 RepID=UPI001444E03E|nr:hydroxyacylglutathione hydrolase [Novosphingobium sp. SG707]NKI98001.1 hydroxyacylglutathione hydrolase [Novosphingobium sp. SG707]
MTILHQGMRVDAGEIVQFPCLADNYGYLLVDSASFRAVAIDTPDPAKALEVLEERGWRLTYILNTHWHDDHVGGNVALKEATGARIIAPAAERRRIPGIDIGIRGGTVIFLGGLVIHAIDTAGHTLGCLSYHVPGMEAVFTGDALFTMGCGRLFEGTPQTAWGGLRRLAELSDETRVYSGHEYGFSNASFALSLGDETEREVTARAQAIVMHRVSSTVPSTIGLEKRTNPFLRLPLAEQCVERQVDRFRELRELKNDFRS